MAPARRLHRSTESGAGVVVSLDDPAPAEPELGNANIPEVENLASLTTAVMSADVVLVVEDLTKEHLYDGNTFLLENGIKFFAAAPIHARSGEVIGCVSIFSAARFHVLVAPCHQFVQRPLHASSQNWSIAPRWRITILLQGLTDVIIHPCIFEVCDLARQYIGVIATMGVTPIGEESARICRVSISGIHQDQVIARSWIATLSHVAIGWGTKVSSVGVS
jgi:hypothetical protein